MSLTPPCDATSWPRGCCRRAVTAAAAEAEVTEAAAEAEAEAEEAKVAAAAGLQSIISFRRRRGTR